MRHTNNRLKTSKPYFLQLESNTTNFRLLLQAAADGTVVTDKRTRAEVRARDLVKVI